MSNVTSFDVFLEILQNCLPAGALDFMLLYCSIDTSKVKTSALVLGSHCDFEISTDLQIVTGSRRASQSSEAKANE
ncbi:MAG: hypothetical protein WCE92_01085 [Nitrososphaeraceae archaeon]